MLTDFAPDRPGRVRPAFTASLLRIDAAGGLVVGSLFLAGSAWIAPLLGLPRPLIVGVALANLAYGCFSFTLNRRPQRPLALLNTLIIGNVAWGVLCLGIAAYVWSDATVLGRLHVLLEAVLVAGLGLVEWRYRDALRARR